MSGGDFVRAVILWLVFMGFGFLVCSAPFWNPDGLIVLVVAFAAVWTPLTLYWAWRMQREGD